MRWSPRHEQRPDAPPAPPGDDRRALGVGTLAWLVLLLACLLAAATGWLSQTGRTWWLWTCLAGTGLGALALARENRRRDRP